MIVTAIVMAGKRDGTLDPLAAEAGVPLKALVPIEGEPLILRTVREVAAAPSVGPVLVVAGDEPLIREALAPLGEETLARIRFVEPRFNLVDSLLAAAEGAEFPLLITTADNVLVTSAGYGEFIAGASAVEGGAAAAFARKEAVLAAHPVGQKKFYEFSDGSFSNCNTYWIADRNALHAAEIMRSGGQFVKFPRRIAQAFGIFNLIRFYFGIGSIEKFWQSVSKRFGFPARHVELSDGAFAIDVDEQRSYNVAATILRQRRDAAAAN